MKFDKNKDEVKNIAILNKEIKKTKSQYSKILIDALLITSSADDFRNIIKESISKHIEDNIRK